MTKEIKVIKARHSSTLILRRNSWKDYVVRRVFRAKLALKARKVILAIVGLRVKLVLRVLRAIKARHLSILILHRNSWKDFVVRRVYRVKRA